MAPSSRAVRSSSSAAAIPRWKRRIFLTRFASKVTVVHRRETLRASKVMQDKAFANPKIEFVWNSEVVDILDGGKGEVTGAVLRNVQTGERTELAVDGVFVAIGHVPNTELFKGKLTLQPDWLHRHRRDEDER